MQENRERIIAWLFHPDVEGNYSNHPDDPGAETKYGISRRWHPEISEEKWACFSPDDAKEIYRSQYWDACGCNLLPYPLDVLVFDAAVQHAPSDAVRMLKQSKNASDFIMIRMNYYTRLKGWSSFGRGWMRRLFRLHKDFVRETL